MSVKSTYALEPKRPVKEAEKLMREAYALFESGFSREDIAKSNEYLLKECIQMDTATLEVSFIGSKPKLNYFRT